MNTKKYTLYLTDFLIVKNMNDSAFFDRNLMQSVMFTGQFN